MERARPLPRHSFAPPTFSAACPFSSSSPPPILFYMCDPFCLQIASLNYSVLLSTQSISTLRLLSSKNLYRSLSYFPAIYFHLSFSSISIHSPFCFTCYSAGSFPVVQYHTFSLGWSAASSFDLQTRRALHHHDTFIHTTVLSDLSQTLPVNPG